MVRRPPLALLLNQRCNRPTAGNVIGSRHDATPDCLAAAASLDQLGSRCFVI